MDPTSTETLRSPTATETLPVLREHIVSTPDTCGGKPRIAGSRIQVKHVAIMHERQGMTPEAIVSEHLHLTLADIYAALTYYHDHREAINAEIVADREWYEEQREKGMSDIAPRSSEKEDHSNVKPFSGTLRVPNPARQSRASSRKRAAMREWHACINERTLYGPSGRGS